MTHKYVQENMYSHFINQVKEYAIFAMDTNGHVTSWNIGAERIKGYTEKDVIGKYYGMLFTEEDQQQGKPREQLETTKREGQCESEGWRRKKDGSLFWAGITLNAIYNDKKDLIGFTKVTRDLSDKKRQEDTLADKNKELTQTNIELDNFIYTASHDLKAPIVNIEGLVQRLNQLYKKKSIQDRDVNQVMDFMQAAVVRLKTTIDDLTTITRIQRDSSEQSNQEQVNIKQIYEDVMADIAFMFESTPCQVTTDFQVEVLSFSRKNFRSILYNLISNAFKFRSNERECQIYVQTRPEQDQVVLTVKDNGLGMSKQNQQRLFTMFKRFHPHVEGSGIGLYIIKRIIENAGGAIEVSSVDGEGTEFRIYFR